MKSISTQLGYFLIFLAIGIGLRLIFSSIGYTYDMESYKIVGEIVHRGGNVYAETTRYNYGPVWFVILGIFYKISLFFTDNFLIFRFLIATLLIVIDIAIAYILFRKISVIAGVLYILNPLSIIITGYYSQFDNLALLIGIVAVLLFNLWEKLNNKSYLYASLVLLGLSLVVKHILFAFPVWLALRKNSSRNKLIILVIPVSIFLFSFLPYLIAGFEGIKENVFLYSSFNNAPFWQAFIPDYMKRVVRKELLFFGSLLCGAILFRNKKPFEQLLLYSIVLVTFSYAIADQYFAIVLPFISAYFNIFFGIFIIIQTLFFSMILSGGEMYLFGMFFERSNFSFSSQVLFLLLGLLFYLYRYTYRSINFKHICIFLVGLNIVLYSFIVIPSYREDYKVAELEEYIEKGNYELANELYTEIEKNPPFAGSRFYEKLKFVRQNIEYYRVYRFAFDGYNDKSLERDWKKIINTLSIIPKYFPDKENVNTIIEYGNSQIEI